MFRNGVGKYREQMLHIIHRHTAERFVPQSIKRALLPTFFPGRSPFGEENDRHQAIFIHVPKTAGSSVHRAFGTTTSRHAPFSRYAAYDPVRTARCFKFCFVRNPWDRLLSAFSYLRYCKANPASQDWRWSHKHLSPYRKFEDFVRALTNPVVRFVVMSYPHFIPQYFWITVPGNPGLQMDLVGRFETLDADFSSIAERLGLDASLHQLRVSRHGPYQELYSPEMRDIVGRLYARDISMFGYHFDGSHR